MRNLLAMAIAVTIAAAAHAAVTSSTQHGATSTSLDSQIAVGDIISGLIATELPGDLGWHPAVGDPLDKLPAFTDGAGIRGTGLTGLLNDNNPGVPVKLIQYDLAQPTDISHIRVLTGNNGKDGRVFSTFTVFASTDNGINFNLLGYFQSDPSGTLNSDASGHQWGSTLVTVFDDTNALLGSGVTNLQFNFYSVDNTGGQMRDPFGGVNPFTGIDDTLSAAFVSPLVFEVDVLPEPATAFLLIGGLVLFSASRRRSC